MKKTQYIKNKDGKFAGSIGMGKNQVPTTPPSIPATVVAATPHNIASEPFNVEHLPNYLNEPKRDASFRMAPLPLPVVDGYTAEELDAYMDYEPASQVELDMDINHLLYDANAVVDEDGSYRDMIFGDSYDEESEDTMNPEEDFTPGVGIIDASYARRFPSDDRLLPLASVARRKANTLRAAGFIHQAYAYEHAAEAIEAAYDLTQSSAHYENSMNAEHWIAKHGAPTPQGADEISTDAFSVAHRREFQRKCLSECEKTIDFPAIFDDSETLRRGAVLRDYLPLAGGDPEAALVMLALLDK